MVGMPLSRDTSSEVNTGSLREQCVFVLMHKCLCVSMRTCPHALGGVKMDPSGQAFPGRVPVDGERVEGRVGGQQGRGSLLMKSHLRPPFTLNMGHCSCPDLGFDPQRCLTPTSPPRAPPPHHLEKMHAYVYIHARSHTHRYIMHVHDDSVYTHMRPQVWIVQVAVQHHAAFRSKRPNYSHLKCVNVVDCWVFLFIAPRRLRILRSTLMSHAQMSVNAVRMLPRSINVTLVSPLFFLMRMQLLGTWGGGGPVTFPERSGTLTPPHTGLYCFLKQFSSK